LPQDHVLAFNDLSNGIVPARFEVDPVES
jgi:hypothetical protein